MLNPIFKYITLIQSKNALFMQISVDLCITIEKFFVHDIFVVNNHVQMNTSPTYSIGVSMTMPSGTLNIQDVVTVYANGTHHKSHSEW